jgi:predicted ATPase
LLALAAEQRTKVPLMIAHRVMGGTLVCTGDFAQGRMHEDEGLALYDPIAHRPLASRFGQDSRVVMLLYRSIALWSLGYPAAARRDVDEALADARGFGQAGTLMFALLHASWPHLQCGDYTAAKAEADELIELAEQKGASLWKAHGIAMQGCLAVLAGRSGDAVRLITSGMAELRATGGTSWAPFHLCHLALAHARLGQSEDAVHCIDVAVRAVEATKESWCEAEVYRTAGEVALMAATPDAAKAQAWFVRALSIASAQNAKSPQLRAAMGLARLYRNQGRTDQARDLLAPVYEWFSEGFDTLDLKEAKELLDELAS